MNGALGENQAATTEPGSGEPRRGAPVLRVAVAINAKAGAARTCDRALLKERITESVGSMGTLTEIVFVEPRDWRRTLGALAVRKDVDAVIVGGGDGSVSSAGAIFVGTGKVMGLIPLGTFNLFARSLRIPIGFEAALDSIETSIVEAVDVGTVVDGAGHSHIFLHHVSLGFHPRFIQIRDAIPYASRMGKMFASLRVWRRTMVSLRRLTLAFSGDLERSAAQYDQVAVTVGSFRDGVFDFPHAEDLTKGDLDLVLVPARSERDFLYAVLLAAVGRWRSNPMMEVVSLHRVRMDSPERRLPVSIDGEVARRPMPLAFEVRPKSLKVLHPPPIAG